MCIHIHFVLDYDIFGLYSLYQFGNYSSCLSCQQDQHNKCLLGTYYVPGFVCMRKYKLKMKPQVWGLRFQKLSPGREESTKLKPTARKSSIKNAGHWQGKLGRGPDVSAVANTRRDRKENESLVLMENKGKDFLFLYLHSPHLLKMDFILLKLEIFRFSPQTPSNKGLLFFPLRYELFDF